MGDTLHPDNIRRRSLGAERLHAARHEATDEFREAMRTTLDRFNPEGGTVYVPDARQTPRVEETPASTTTSHSTESRGPVQECAPYHSGVAEEGKAYFI